MPKRTDIEKVLIIGSGPIVIGQACEFDYSGTQACKALRALGYEIVLANSNPATIMTDPGMADVTYLEPLNLARMTEIIEKERPDALLPTMGGQTALNCALDLAREGVLSKFDVELIGASKKAIDKAEDREKFKAAMTRIGLASARSGIAHNIEPVHHRASGIRTQKSAEHSKQGALSASVRAHEADGLAAIYSERDSAQHPSDAESLSHATSVDRPFSLSGLHWGTLSFALASGHQPTPVRY